MVKKENLFLPDENGIIRILSDEISEVNRKRIIKFSAFMFLYDFIQNHWVRPRIHKADPKQHQKILSELLAPVKETAVLDLACGTGGAIPYFHRSNEYTGLDISYAMLKQAAKKVQARGFRSYKLMEGNAESIIFTNESFSVILIDTSLHMIQQYQKCIAEAARVLKKGGHLICSCPAVGIDHKFDDLWKKIAPRRNLHSLKESDLQLVCRENGLSYEFITTNGGVVYFRACKE